MAWSSRLRDASYRGVPIEVTELSDEGGRSLLLAEYPGRDGASVDDQGARPRRGRMSVICHGEDYEDTLSQLLAVFGLSGAGELVHPIFGSYQAAVESWTVNHSADGRDEARVEFSWVESALDVLGLEVVLDSPAALQARVYLDADEFEILAAAHPEGASLLATVRTLTAGVRSAASRLANPDMAVARTATQVLAEVQTAGQAVLDAIRTVQHPENQPLVRQAKRTLLTVAQLQRAVLHDAPSWTTYEVPAWTTARLIAAELYGDGDRAAEIVRDNALRDPGRIGPGTVLSVRSR